MRSLLRLVLSVLVALVGAASAATLTLSPGQTGRLGDLTLTVLRVQDSRCRPGTQCIQAGELRASVFVVRGPRTRLVTLTFPQATSSLPAGFLITEATFGERENGRTRQPTLTFSDTRP